MLRNVIKALTKNLGLKLLALLFAVTMWMAVVSMDDPPINKRFTIAVTVENEDAIKAMNKYYEMEGDSSNVTFNVMGKRSVMSEISGSDFKAVADLSQLIQREDENVVPIEITALRHSNELTISKRTRELKIILEDLMTQRFVIQPVAQGNPAEGYALGEMTVAPNRVTISGPKAVVSQVDSVKAPIDILDMSTDITDSVVPLLLDENGDTVDTTRLSCSVDIVTVRVDIVSEKSVPIKVNYNGEPKDGFEVISAKAEPAEVTIKGNSEILNMISSIVIPESDISVEGADEEFEQRVDINRYLPEGVSLSNSAQATITVKVDIEELERRVIHVPSRNIAVDGLPEGYQIEFNDQTVDIEVYGLAADLNRLSANALRPVLDVSNVGPGRHVGQLQLTVDSEYIIGDTSVSFTIFSENTDGDDEEGEDNTDHPDQTEPDEDTNTDTDTDKEIDTNTDDNTEADDHRAVTGIDDISDREEE